MSPESPCAINRHHYRDRSIFPQQKGANHDGGHHHLWKRRLTLYYSGQGGLQGTPLY